MFCSYRAAPFVAKVCSLFLLLCFGVAHAAESWIERSDEYALKVLRSSAQFRPEGASRAGLDEYDAEVIDLGENLSERMSTEERRLIGMLDEAAEDEEDPRVVQDIAILKKALEDSLSTRALYEERMLPYIDLSGLMFGSFRAILDPRNDPERFKHAITRLRRYAGLEDGYVSVAEQAKARTAERFDTPGLLGPYIGELQRDFDSAPRYVEGIRQLFMRSGLKGWEDDFEVLEAQLGEYTDWLKAEIQPRARQNTTLPAELYADNLNNFGVDASPDALIREGQAAYQFIRSEMKALARRIAEAEGWKDASLLSVIRKLKSEQVPEDELLTLYKARLKEIEAIIRREGIVTLPERDAAIRVATEAESAAIPASFMNRPQLIGNTGQYGEFVLVQSNPSLGEDARMDDWGHEAITWALTVHEARPGHEMQFASLVENGTSLARAMFAFNSANVEGWGLYAEAIMHEHLPLEGQLFNLYTRLLRAARMFLDPMVNTGRIHRDDAQRFLMEQCAMSKAMASSEADRYAFRMPGQATAYYYGYQNLMRLRTEVELAMGAQFDQQAFHDFVIAQGLLPPELLRETVLAHFHR